MPMELDPSGKKNPSMLPAIIIQCLPTSLRLLYDETIMIASISVEKRPPICMKPIVAQLSTSSVYDTLTTTMNPKELVNELFALDEKIRWVGIVDQRGDILENAQRPGTKSYVDSKTEERTLKEFPTIMGLFWRELVGSSGELKSVIVAYSRVYLFAFYVDELLVVVSFDPSGMPAVVNSLAARYGTLVPKGNQDTGASGRGDD
jgi:hypothetical protein